MPPMAAVVAAEEPEIAAKNAPGDNGNQGDAARHPTDQGVREFHQFFG